ncbi:MAG: response regulator [Elusimicrobiota bacterium]
MPAKIILIVEDEPAVADLLKFLFEKDGYTTISASDGEEAISLATSNKPDLILLDLMIPKIDGYSVYRQLQADETTANIRIIVLTAKSGMQDLFQFEKNIVAYMEKPFDPKILRDKVKEALNG